MDIKENNIDSKQYKSLHFFKNLPLFTDISDEETAAFSSAALIKSYKKGHLLYQEDEQADFFYVICSGWVKLFYTTEDGKEVSLAVLTQNSVTGESAIFENGRFSSSAQIAEDAQILRIPLGLLKEKLRTNSQLAHNMLASMVQYQRQQELQFEQYLLYSAPQRIGSFLLELCPVHQQVDGAMFSLPYDKTLIASVLGMKGATFSRALNILREETGIHISGTSVKIDSIARLLAFVDGCYSQASLRGK